eukprot:477421-Rhodomonas_salina.2
MQHLKPQPSTLKPQTSNLKPQTSNLKASNLKKPLKTSNVGLGHVRASSLKRQAYVSNQTSENEGVSQTSSLKLGDVFGTDRRVAGSNARGRVDAT